MDGSVAWFASADDHVKEAVGMIKQALESGGKGMALKKWQTPFPGGCELELDLPDELSEGVAFQLLRMVGVLRWGVELGRMGALLETSLLAQHSASPQVGHLEMPCHGFGCWMAHPRPKLVFDPAEPVVDESAFGTTRTGSHSAGTHRRRSLPSCRNQEVIL
jgi:hypothetical protein